MLHARFAGQARARQKLQKHQSRPVPNAGGSPKKARGVKEMDRQVGIAGNMIKYDSSD